MCVLPKNAIGACSGCSLTTGVNNTIIGQLPGAAACVCTLLLGAGTCQRLLVDNSGLGVNGCAQVIMPTANAAGYLCNNGTGTLAWGTVSGGGATITNDTSSAGPYYPGMSSATSGSWTTAYITNTKFYFAPSTGTLSATIFTSLSDRQLKENITTLANVTEIINKLIPVSFNWKDTGNKSYGVIAQDIETILPELVETNPDTGYKSVSYTQIIPFLITEVKELRQEINELKKLLGGK